ncbi:MAG: translation initiation factor IF-2 [Nitrososphaerota archaeon]|nr:translation initiation factor IF-2 [Candidatus Calditenuaceae archaeon]MDW8073417.1 translation initiation factor IF-2 [Nitrososphaerota archaeon]
MSWIREPIVVVLGHVDHGKTSLLDKMRGTVVARREAGGITQHIGASHFPLDAVLETCRRLLGEVRVQLKIPGLLFIDTPGHQVFANLRKRGGSIADMAVLVVDVMQGIQEQTVESIQLLRARKTPFVVALNKIDMITGWRPVPGAPLKDSLNGQAPQVRETLETRLYTVVGQLSNLGFQSDLYMRISNFARTVAIVPVSAKTGEGVADLLLVILGLAQAYMSKQLEAREDGAEGAVLEVVEEVGLGATVNAVINNGVLRVEDRIAVLSREGPTVVKVRALLMPKPLDEMRDPRDRFRLVEEVKASAGVKIAGEGLDKVVPGSPLYVVESDENLDEIFEKLRSEVEEFVLRTDKLGVIVKADTLGTLEAMVNYLREKGIPIRAADIGDISKRDVMESSAVKLREEFLGVILAFNVDIPKELEAEAASRGVRIFRGEVLFRLVDDYLQWVEGTKEERARASFERLIKPAKIKVLEGFVFRRSNPAIFGVEVLSGELTPHVSLMNSSGRVVGVVTQLQNMGRPVAAASAGERVAVSMREPIVGRHIKEGEILYVAVPEGDARLLLSTFQDRLSDDAKVALKEIVEIKRKANPIWAM